MHTISTTVLAFHSSHCYPWSICRTPVKHLLDVLHQSIQLVLNKSIKYIATMWKHMQVFSRRNFAQCEKEKYRSSSFPRIIPHPNPNSDRFRLSLRYSSQVLRDLHTNPDPAARPQDSQKGGWDWVSERALFTASSSIKRYPINLFCYLWRWRTKTRLEAGDFQRNVDLVNICSTPWQLALTGGINGITGCRRAGTMLEHSERLYVSSSRLYWTWLCFCWGWTPADGEDDKVIIELTGLPSRTI